MNLGNKIENKMTLKYFSFSRHTHMYTYKRMYVHILALDLLVKICNIFEFGLEKIMNWI